ncbi:hypothetical protein J6590_007604 [Homalodisca vitripennis]|nr:hypothetical protein J6590_007604 [Homalodisca vitripennis]
MCLHEVLRIEDYDHFIQGSLSTATTRRNCETPRGKESFLCVTLYDIVNSVEYRLLRLSRYNRVKQRRAWLATLGWVTAKQFSHCKQLACPAVGGGS